MDRAGAGTVSAGPTAGELAIVADDEGEDAYIHAFSLLAGGDGQGDLSEAFVRRLMWCALAYALIGTVRENRLEPGSKLS